MSETGEDINQNDNNIGSTEVTCLNLPGASSWFATVKNMLVLTGTDLCALVPTGTYWYLLLQMTSTNWCALVKTTGTNWCGEIQTGFHWYVSAFDNAVTLLPWSCLMSPGHIRTDPGTSILVWLNQPTAWITMTSRLT